MKPIKKNSLPLFDTQVDKKSMRLNLCSSSRILSDRYEHNNNGLLSENSPVCADKTSLDGTVLSDLEDYPPPPGFFFCFMTPKRRQILLRLNCYYFIIILSDIMFTLRGIMKNDK